MEAKGEHVTGRRVTMRDVADAAGVSHMTVSRVVNGNASVNRDTRLSVEAAIQRLSFTPNPAARALSNARQIRVALLHRFPNPGSLGYFLIHLMQASSRAHASVIVREIIDPAEDEAAVAELAEQQVGGVILAPPLGEDRRLIALLGARGMSVVATGSTRRAIEVPSIGIDDRQAAFDATQYLISLGHRRIGHIAGDRAYASSVLRREGWEAALRRAGLAAEPALLAQGRYTYRSGLEAAEMLLDAAAPPTAIFAGNDEMAAACIAVAHRRGIDVPEALSVCGFDDSPLATMIWPELTTIATPGRDLTRQAFEMVLRAIRGESAHVADSAFRVSLDHALIRRGSVAGVAAADRA